MTPLFVRPRLALLRQRVWTQAGLFAFHAGVIALAFWCVRRAGAAQRDVRRLTGSAGQALAPEARAQAEACDTGRPSPNRLRPAE